MHVLGKAARLAATAAVVLALGSGTNAGSISIHHRTEVAEAADLKDYERAVKLRDMAPQKFDQIHKLAGELLSHESVYETLLHEWQEHPARFERDHRCVWHVLAGDMIYHEMHPYEPPLVSSSGGPNTPNSLLPPGGTGPPGSGNPPPGGGLHDASVPEPSAMLLLASGLVIVGLATARSRFQRICAHFGRRPVQMTSDGP